MEIRFSRWHGIWVESVGRIPRSGNEVVLDRGKDVSFLKVRRANGGKPQRRILHHRLQARGTGERRSCGVGIFGIDELLDETSCVTQDALVGVVSDDERIRIPGIDGQPGCWIWRIALRIDRRSQEWIEKIIFNVARDGCSVMAATSDDHARLFLRFTRNSHEVELKASRTGDAQCREDPVEHLAVRILNKDGMRPALRDPCIDQPMPIQQPMHIAVTMGFAL